MSWEFFERRMDALREEICHPLAGIYTDEDWAAFKDVYGPPCCLPETFFACACMQQLHGLHHNLLPDVWPRQTGYGALLHGVSFSHTCLWERSHSRQWSRKGALAPEVSTEHADRECRVYDKVPELMEKRFKMHSDQGFSGLLGGFEEEHRVLNGIGSNVVPEDHVARPMLAVMTHRIANNPQWKWQEKVRAVHKVAHLLLRGERHARRTAGASEAASTS